MTEPGTVIVCGGGVVGLCTAYYLAKERWEVTVVERNAEGSDSCAHGSAGYVSPSHVLPVSAPGMVWQRLKWMLSSRSPFYIKPRLDPDLIRWLLLFARNCNVAHARRAAPILRDLCLVSRELFLELARETGNSFDLQTEGLLNVCKTNEGLEHEINGPARFATEVGIEARVLTARETAAMEPGMRLDIAGAVYFPIDAHVTPSKFIVTLTEMLKKAGVTFRWNTNVSGWNTNRTRITEAITPNGRVTADEYVVTTGSWAGETIRNLELTHTTRQRLQYHH
jgi:D-amino-acid dehydrogenase